MDSEITSTIRAALERAIQTDRRGIEAASTRYWYPLSLPTYGADEILESLDSMCSFKTSMGHKTLQFERQFSEYQGCANAVMVNSGSSADLLLGLLLNNPLDPKVDADAEVLVPVLTWPTQVWSMKMAGLRTKLVDVDPATLNVDLDDLAQSVSGRTRAIFIVHLMGNPCHMDRVAKICCKHDLLTIEDCCESMGATWNGVKVGNFGLGGAFSFFFSHHITTMEGGMIAVNDPVSAEQLRILRAHGWLRNADTSRYKLHEYPDIDARYAFVNWGLNVRPTELQAGFGIHQLQRAEAFAARRQQLVRRFSSFLSRTAALAMPDVEAEASPSWLAIPLMVQKGAPFSKKDITTYLENVGVETRPIVAGNLARHPVAALFPEFRQRKFSGADQVHERGFYIGLSPMQTDATMDRLIDVFYSFLSKW